MRRLIAAAAALLVLIVVATAIAVSRFNDYLATHQSALAAQVGAAIGRPVAFDSVRVAYAFPPEARISNLRIGGAAETGDSDLLRAGTVSISVDPLRAVFGELRVRAVTLDAPVITIARPPPDRSAAVAPPVAGQPDTASPLPAVEAAEPAAPATAPARAAGPPPTASSKSAAVSVARLSARNGIIQYVGQGRDRPGRIVITRLDLDAYDLDSAHPARFTLRAALFEASAQNLSAHGTAGLQPGAPFDLSATADGVVIDQLRDLPDAAAWFPDGLSSAEAIRLEVALRGTSDQLELHLSGDAGAAAVRYGDWFDKPAGMPLALRAEAVYTAATETVAVRSATLTLATLAASVAGTVDRGDPPRVDLRLSAPTTALDGIAASIPALAKRGASGTVSIDLQARGALTADGIAALNGRIDLHQVSLGSRDLPGRISNLTAPLIFAGDSAELATTTVTVGTTPVAFGCRAAPLAAPTVACSLSAAALTPADLGIDGAAGDRFERVAIDASLRPADPQPAVTFVLQADGRAQGVAFQNLRVQTRAHDGQFVIDRGAVEALGGTIEASGTYRSPRHGTQGFDLRGQARGLRLDQLLAGFQVPGAARYQGRLHATFDLAGSGDDSAALERGLRGTAQVELRDGVVRDFDLDAEALGAFAPLVSSRIRSRHPDLFGGDLRVTEASGTLAVANRRLSTDDSRVRSPDVGVGARGTMDFDGRLDLRGTMTLSPSLTSDVFGGSATVRELSSASGGLDIRFTLGGTIEKPRLRLSGEVLADVLGRGIESIVGDGSAGGKKVGDLIKKGLDSLFQR